MSLKQLSGWLMFDVNVLSPTYVESAWRRWVNAQEIVHAQKRSLWRQIFFVLVREHILAGLLVAANVGLGFVSALLLRDFLIRLVAGNKDVGSLVLLSVEVVATTIGSWILLNHVFLMADLIGVGARTYTESVVLRNLHTSIEGRFKSGELANVIDREGGRIEAAWGGQVMIALSAATLVATSIFYFVALGPSAIVALSTIAAGAVVVLIMGRMLNRIYASVSVQSSRRAGCATFLFQHRLAIILNGWAHELGASHAGLRQLEEAGLMQAGYILSAISVVAAVTPVGALLFAVLAQLVWWGSVDTPGVMSAIALIGGLRSVANGIPDAIRTLTQGRVALNQIDKLVASKSAARQATSMPLPVPKFRHISIVGESGSGRTSILRGLAKASDTASVFLGGTDPWIFTGSMRRNITLANSTAADDDILRAMEWARLDKNLLWVKDGAERHLASSEWGLSRGQAKRLELARAVLSDVEEIYLDQPTLGVDDTTADGLMQDLLSGPWWEKKVFYITDKTDEASLAPEIWTVSGGRVTNVAYSRPKNDRRWQEMTAASRAPSPAIAPSRRTIQGPPRRYCRAAYFALMKRIAQIGLVGTLFIMFPLLMTRESIGVAADYALTHARWALSPTRGIWTVATLTGIAAVFSIAATLHATKSVTRITTQHCIGFVGALLNPLSWQDAKEGEDNIGRLVRDQRRVDEMLPAYTLELLGAVCLLTATLFYAALTVKFLTFIFLPLICILYMLNRHASVSLSTANIQDQALSANFIQNMSELSAGSLALNSGRSGSRVLAWLETPMRDRLIGSMRNFFVQYNFAYKVDLVGVSAFGVVAVGAALIVTPSNMLSLGLATSLAYSIISMFGRVLRGSVQINQVLDNCDRLSRVPARDLAMSNRKEIAGAISAKGIAFKSVRFAYSSGTKQIISLLNAWLPQGTMVAITGPSGSGKSTLAEIICGGKMPTSGRVELDGDARPYILWPELGGRVLLFTSSPIFKPGLFLNSFGLAASQVDLLLNAARDLKAAEALALLPGGPRHVVSGDGILPLGKSDTQKMSVLRAVMLKPQIAIFDEALSQLSYLEELAYVETLRKSLPLTTLIFITHNRAIADRCAMSIEFSGKNGTVFVTRCADFS